MDVWSTCEAEVKANSHTHINSTGTKKIELQVTKINILWQFSRVKIIHIQENINSYVPNKITSESMRYNRRSNKKITKSQTKSNTYLQFLNSQME